MYRFLLMLSLAMLSLPLYAADEPPRDQGMMQTVIMIGIAMVFFYFILWRPEQKRRKAAEEQRNSLQKGDTVVAMGIVGTVHQIKENTIVLKMIDGNKIEVVKGAVTEITAPTSVSEATAD